MARARLLYFVFLGLALALFGLAAWLPNRASDIGSIRGLLRFVVFFLAIGSALGAWGTAVMIASVHRVVWPLVTTTVVVLVVLSTVGVWVLVG